MAEQGTEKTKLQQDDPSIILCTVKEQTIKQNYNVKSSKSQSSASTTNFAKKETRAKTAPVANNRKGKQK